MKLFLFKDLAFKDRFIYSLIPAFRVPLKAPGALTLRYNKTNPYQLISVLIADTEQYLVRELFFNELSPQNSLMNIVAGLYFFIYLNPFVMCSFY